jgi:hypothetical protein
VLSIYPTDEKMQSEKVLENLFEFFTSLLRLQDRVLLYSGMYIDLSPHGSCLVQLDFLDSFVILSRENILLIDMKLEKYDYSRNIEKLNLNDSEIVNHLSFDADLIRNATVALRSNIDFTENHKRLGVYSNI